MTELGKMFTPRGAFVDLCGPVMAELKHIYGDHVRFEFFDFNETLGVCLKLGSKRRAAYFSPDGKRYHWPKDEEPWWDWCNLLSDAIPATEAMWKYLQEHQT